MPKISADRVRYCDGISRRSFFQIGAAGLGGLTLANLLRAESTGAARPTNKAIINIHLGGGPPHQDMFDLKPTAPAEVRGEFRPIATNVPGIDICELFPRLAAMTDKLAIVRSLVGSVGDHDFYQTSSGWGVRDLSSAGGRPSLGSVTGKLIGSLDGKSPPYVDFMSRDGMPGYLGSEHSAYWPDPYGDGAANLRMHRTLSVRRIEERVGLLQGLDRMQETTRTMAARDSFTQRAVDVLTSGKVAKALDLANEDPRLINRYKGGEHVHERAKIMVPHNERLLIARRLIEAGVRCVSMQWGGWDTHTDNFSTLKPQLPMMDIGFSALIEDLTARAMLDDVMVVAWGEFGRTPRINALAGRDHWPQVGCALMFGGGLKGGQVIGATNRLGEFATDRPVHFQELMATFYRQMGIDLEATQLLDLNGRPQYLLEHRAWVPELV